MNDSSYDLAMTHIPAPTPELIPSKPAGFGNRAQRRMMQKLFRANMTEAIKEYRSQISPHDRSPRS